VSGINNPAVERMGYVVLQGMDFMRGMNPACESNCEERVENLKVTWNQRFPSCTKSKIVRNKMVQKQVQGNILCNLVAKFFDVFVVNFFDSV
jgi:hypothetical protein